MIARNRGPVFRENRGKAEETELGISLGIPDLWPRFPRYISSEGSVVTSLGSETETLIPRNHRCREGSDVHDIRTHSEASRLKTIGRLSQTGDLNPQVIIPPEADNRRVRIPYLGLR